VTYLDLFSGIGTASLAFDPYGWHCLAHAETDPFASAVLAHRFPDTPNLGDVRNFEEWPDLGTVDLVCGGTPCQSFSIAGLRQGLDDPRGRLMLTYLAVARRYRPRWLVWENVLNALSIDEGRAFATLLRGLEECGYHAAWRVLDAQFVRTQRFPRAVPQRRRRVFLVGYLGDWRGPAEVLFEPESLRRDSPPSRTPGQGASADVAQSLVASGRGVERTGESRGQDNVIAARLVSFGEYETDDVASTVQNRDYKYATDLVAHTLRSEGFDASEDGTGRGPPLVCFPAEMSATQTHIRGDIAGALSVKHLQAIAFDAKRNGGVSEDAAPTLRAMDHDSSHANAGGMMAVAIQERAVAENPKSGPDGKGWRDDGAAYSLEARGPQAVASEREQWAVRRLTPRECERLQGLPDDFTNIPWRGKNHAPDGPRYRAIGNAWPLNVADWLAGRIDQQEREG
jgi:DNA (cytosine-5)-methyltransferase 1